MKEPKKVILKRGKEASLLRFHPWIFSGAIEETEEGAADGDIVRVFTHDNRFAAVGHFQAGSIAVRVLSFNDEEIGGGFWRRRLSDALKLRDALGLAFREGNAIFRLVHGEGDGLPALVIDVYGSTAVMQAYSAGMRRARRDIAEALLSVMQGRVAAVYCKSDPALPCASGDTAEERTAGAPCGGSGTAEESGLKFRIDWAGGQKTGFFIDQRENRRIVERYAAGRKTLDLFCYTGGFSAYALRGGASLVHSVDSSPKAAALARENILLNFPGCGVHETFAENAFKFLRDAAPGGYDMMILDPPAFAKHLDAVRSALRGYQRLNAAAIGKIAKGGMLFTFSCSQAVTKEQFRLAVFSAAAQAGRRARILHQLHQPADHPVNICHPEGEYLKGLALYID